MTNKELENAKSKLLGHLLLALETNSDKSSNFVNCEISGDGYDYINRLPDLINSVTVTDIITVANKYFTDDIVQSVVIPKNTLNK